MFDEDWQKINAVWLSCHYSDDADTRTLHVMALVLILAFFVTLAVACVCGLGADSRDPSFSLFSRRDDARFRPRS